MVSGLVHGKTGKGGTRACAQASGSTGTLLSIAGCLALRAPGGIRRGGECRTAGSRSLQPVTRRLAARPAPAWQPLGAAAERSFEHAASARGPGVWWSGPARPKDLHLLHCLLLTPRPASPDRGLLCCLKKPPKNKNGERKRNPLTKMKIPCCYSMPA